AVHNAADPAIRGFNVRYSTDGGLSLNSSGSLAIKDITSGKGRSTPNRLDMYDASASTLTWRQYEVSLAEVPASSTIRIVLQGNSLETASSRFFVDNLVVGPVIKKDLEVLGVRASIQDYSTCSPSSVG
ncbi:MAG: hypothetical protein ACK55I_30655, partial [bacterium]